VQALSSSDRRKILLDLADALEANEELIRKENESDVCIAKEARITEALVSRLTLKPGKVSQISFILFGDKVGKATKIMAFPSHHPF
jgi:delta-1-pyrroline-5-carboxylate synthetase